MKAKNEREKNITTLFNWSEINQNLGSVMVLVMGRA
jgi:hypothetical protein